MDAHIDENSDVRSGKSWYSQGTEMLVPIGSAYFAKKYDGTNKDEIMDFIKQCMLHGSQRIRRYCGEHRMSTHYLGFLDDGVSGFGNWDLCEFRDGSYPKNSIVFNFSKTADCYLRSDDIVILRPNETVAYSPNTNALYAIDFLFLDFVEVSGDKAKEDVVVNTTIVRRARFDKFEKNCRHQASSEGLSERLECEKRMEKFYNHLSNSISGSKDGMPYAIFKPNNALIEFLEKEIAKAKEREEKGEKNEDLEKFIDLQRWVMTDVSGVAPDVLKGAESKGLDRIYYKD